MSPTSSTPPTTHEAWLHLFTHLTTHLQTPSTETTTPSPSPSPSPPLTPPHLASLIDHTLLSPTTTPIQIRTLCSEARTHSFRTVCIRPEHVALAAAELRDTKEVQVCAVIEFPVDDGPPPQTEAGKVREAREVVERGAGEVDMVIDYEMLVRGGEVNLTDGNDAEEEEEEANPYSRVLELIAIVRAAIPPETILKVILETSQLSDEDIARGTIIACIGGADFVKTSTGFRGAGATVEDVRLMRTVADVCQGEGLTEGGKRVRVKASGGVRTVGDVKRMVAAGAERIGASAGVGIMKGLEEEGRKGGERRGGGIYWRER